MKVYVLTAYSDWDDDHYIDSVHKNYESSEKNMKKTSGKYPTIEEFEVEE